MARFLGSITVRIGIPGILPTVGFILGIALGAVVFKLGSTADFDAESIALIAVVSSPSLLMIGILTYRYKLVVIGRSSLVVVKPFHFHYKSIDFEKISKVNWKIWETLKIGDYRKIEVKTVDNYKLYFSDLEFSNFDHLEGLLIEKVGSKADLAQKKTIEIQQAKSNKWLNIMLIPVFGFFLFLIGSQMNLDNLSPAGLGILGVVFLLIIRTIKLIQTYNQWTEKYDRVRSRRLKKLKSKKSTRR